MKKIALFSAFLAFAQIASASQILSIYRYKNADGSTQKQVYNGFSEDGFTRAETTCYTESALGVCALIAQAQGETERQYSQGAHGTFVVKSCEVVGNVVKLNYDRQNDYGPDADDLDIKLDIKACTGRE